MESKWVVVELKFYFPMTFPTIYFVSHIVKTGWRVIGIILGTGSFGDFYLPAGRTLTISPIKCATHFTNAKSDFLKILRNFHMLEKHQVGFFSLLMSLTFCLNFVFIFLVKIYCFFFFIHYNFSKAATISVHAPRNENVVRSAMATIKFIL